MYYGNAAAGAPPDDDVDRTTTCGWEYGVCFTYYNYNEPVIQSTNAAKFGAMGGVAENGDTALATNVISLGNRTDLNYSTYFKPLGNYGVWSITKAGGDSILYIIFRTDGKIYYGGAGETDSGVTYTNNWHYLEIQYIDSAPTANAAIYNSDKQLLNRIIGKNVANSAVVAGEALYSDYYDPRADAYFDNTYLAPPTKASGLGNEE